jgi:hypothetical protein
LQRAHRDDQNGHIICIFWNSYAQDTKGTNSDVTLMSSCYSAMQTTSRSATWQHATGRPTHQRPIGWEVAARIASPTRMRRITLPCGAWPLASARGRGSAPCAGRSGSAGHVSLTGKGWGEAVPRLAWLNRVRPDPAGWTARLSIFCVGSAPKHSGSTQFSTPKDRFSQGHCQHAMEHTQQPWELP